MNYKSAFNFLLFIYLFYALSDSLLVSDPIDIREETVTTILIEITLIDDVCKNLYQPPKPPHFITS